MRRMLDEARGKGYSSAHTYVEADSPKEEFLTKMGFYKVGMYRDRYGKGNDASIWQYLIKE